MSTIYSNVQTVNTVLGLLNQINAQFKIVGKINLAHTLNRKYEVYDTEITHQPTDNVSLKYFGIGIRGAYSTAHENDNLVSGDAMLVSPTTPYRPSAENMDLYTPIPFRMIPEEDPGVEPVFDDRDKYRMHVVYTDPDTGDVYHQYWLKLIEVGDGVEGVEASMSRIPVDTGIEDHNYVLDPAKGITDNPQPIISEIFEVTDRVNVSISRTCTVTGNEIAEAVEYLYGGNIAYGFISEVGFYTGEDTLDPVPEAIGVQLAIHRCMSAIDMSAKGSVLTLPIIIANGSSVISGTYIPDAV